MTSMEINLSERMSLKIMCELDVPDKMPKKVYVGNQTPVCSLSKG